MRRLAAAVALLWLTLVATAAPALAHANLVRSEPPSNASLDQAPGRVQLWFSERPEPKLSEIQVFNAQRQRVDQGPPAVAPTAAQSLISNLEPGLQQGVYTVSWHTTSAVDGHVTGGAFAFGVGVAPSPADLSALATAAQQPQPRATGAIIRWAGYIGAAGLLGLALFGLLVVEPSGSALGAASDRLARRLTRVGQMLAGLLLVSAVAMIADQAVQSGAGFGATLSTALGANLALRVALAALILIVLLVDARAVLPRGLTVHRSLGAAAAQVFPAAAHGVEVVRPGLILALLAYLLLYALTSHAQAVSGSPELALFVDWLHLAVAGVWIGGLLALAAGVVPELGSWVRPAASVGTGDVERNRMFGPLLAGFSRVALISVIGLALTGFYQGLVHVGSIDNALNTSFGQTLIVKTAIFGLALLLAGFHRWFLVPALAQPNKVAATRARRFLSRTLPLEALLGVAILGTTGLLTSLAPANNQEAGGVQTKTLGDDRVTFQVAPLRVGSNLFQVTVGSKGQPVNNADKVELQLTMLDMDMGTSVLELQPKGQGVYAAQGELLSMSGHWRVGLLLRLPGQLDQRTSFELQVKT